MKELRMIQTVAGQEWVGVFVSQEGKEVTLEFPLRIMLVRDPAKESGSKVTLIPALYFAENPKEKITVTTVYGAIQAHSDIEDHYRELTSGIIRPESSLITG